MKIIDIYEYGLNYSTPIGRLYEKRRKTNPVGLTVRQCGDLS